MPVAQLNGIEIEYVTDGDPHGPPTLLIAGIGLQLIGWPQEFVDRLARAGLFVIRYDNRDSGRSTKFRGLPDMSALFSGVRNSAPYRIEDMAADAQALLSYLGATPAHVIGMSMGGMITQALAIHFPGAVASACSIMSTTGDASVGRPTDAALEALMRPRAADRDAAITGAVELSRLISSPGYPIDDAERRARAVAAYDRSYCPDGTLRQAAAILASPDRSEALRNVRMPFLVIHGEDDPMIAPSGGEATAAAVPGARLLTFPGMGHDLPSQLLDEIVAAILANISEA